MSKSTWRRTLALLLLAVLNPCPSFAGVYEGTVSERIDNDKWILMIGGRRYFVEMSLCLSLALPLEDVIVKSADAVLGPGDEVIFVDDKETCTVRDAAPLSH